MRLLTAILTLISLTVFNDTVACSCIGKSSVTEEVKKTDVVFIGKVVGKTAVKIWSDTTGTRFSYEKEKKKEKMDTLSYDEYKWRRGLFGIDMVDYQIVVSKKYKGHHLQDTITVRTGLGSGDCGFEFQLGSNYLVYARRESSVKYTLPKLGRNRKELKGIFRTNICSRTKPVERAEDDLKYLENN
jgi:hypothetical protein